MHRPGTAVLSFLVAVLVLATASPGARAPRDGAGDPSAARPTVMRPPPTPVLFEENRGQTDARVAFLVRGLDRTAWFTDRGVTWALRGQGGRWVLKADFVGAARVRPVGVCWADTVVSYFRGRPGEWRTGCRTCRQILYRNLWPGIDLVVDAEASALKATFIVWPGADDSRIRIRWRGTTGLSVTEGGDLLAATGFGPLLDAAPTAWQADGRSVAAAWSVAADTASFGIGDHDPAQALFIDPAVFIYAGYIGGDGYDDGAAIAVDGNRAAYVTGVTWSSAATFPLAVGPNLDPGGTGVFVAKVRPDGTGLSWCGYLGGGAGSSQFGKAIAVDGAGCAYVAGYTNGTEVSFPVVNGPDLTHNGDYDAFVAKVAADGTGLVYCGYVGGAAEDQGLAIAVDAAGGAYVAGATNSTEGTFPLSGGLDATFNGGSYDGFVAKVQADGAGLAWSGYLGGTGDNDRVTGIAVDGLGAAYVTGSAGTGFPTTVGPDLTFNGASGDAFVAKVAAGGAGLDYCGYIGGPLEDGGRAIAVRDGYAYVAGTTWSGEAFFPVTVGPDLTINFGYDGFVAKVNQAGTGFVYCGYLGGTQYDQILGIAVDGSGRALVTGATNSAETQNFPVASGPDLTFNGGTNDAFIARVAADGTALEYCGYIGGDAADEGQGIAVDGSGDAHVIGYSEFSTAGFPIVGPDLSPNGSRDVFVAKVGVGTYSLVLGKGKITDSTKALKDSIKVSGTVSPPGGFPWALNPALEAVTIEVGEGTDPFTLTIPAGDPGWKSSKGKHSWKGAAGSLKVDTGKRTISFAAKGFDFATTPANPIHVQFESGILPLAVDTPWTANPKAPGSFKYP